MDLTKHATAKYAGAYELHPDQPHAYHMEFKAVSSLTKCHSFQLNIPHTLKNVNALYIQLCFLQNCMSRGFIICTSGQGRSAAPGSYPDVCLAFFEREGCLVAYILF